MPIVVVLPEPLGPRNPSLSRNRQAEPIDNVPVATPFREPVSKDRRLGNRTRRFASPMMAVMGLPTAI
jgi:hypothetical protein